MKGLGILLPILLLLWAGVGAWRDFETWVTSPDLYLPMEQHIHRAIDELAQQPDQSVVYFSPFTADHPVLRVRDAGLEGVRLGGFKAYECLVVPQAAEVTYFSLDLFDPGFGARLGEWGTVTRTGVDEERAAFYQLIPNTRMTNEWGAERIDFGEVSVSFLRLLPETARPGETVQMALGLRGQTALTRSYTAFVHFYGDPSPVEGGAILAQVDAPLCPSYPPPAWLPGETIIQPLTLTLPSDLVPGRYQLSLGIYDSLTFDRLPVNYPSGQSDYVAIANIDITLD